MTMALALERAEAPGQVRSASGAPWSWTADQRRSLSLQ